jgi:hypothetical protein
MTTTCRRSALAVLAGFLLFLSNCRQARKESGPQYIMLTFNAGACEQNGSTGVIEIDQNRAVIYQIAAELPQFEVRFKACPFASCPVTSPHGTSVNVGKPNAGAAGTTFTYSGLTINNQACNDAGAMGVHVKPGL